MDIHEEMDATKSALADVRHRAVFHSAYGIYIVQRIFGQTRTNSAGKVYSVRDIAEQHIMEDLGRIPTLQDWMEGAEIKPWMMGKREVKETTTISWDGKPGTVPIKLPVERSAPHVSTWEVDGSQRLPTNEGAAPVPSMPIIPQSWPQPAIPDADIATTHPDFARTITID